MMNSKKSKQEISLKILIICCISIFVITFFMGLWVGNTIFASSNDDSNDNSNQNTNTDTKANNLINFVGSEDEFKLFCEDFSNNLDKYQTLDEEDNLVLKSNYSQYSLNEVRNLCRKSQGIWINDFLDCEFIPEQLCTELGGEFNQCSSACRNDPNAWVCTRECIPVCDFSNTTFNNSNHDLEGKEEVIIYDSYENQVPNNCSNWFDGCNNCIIMQNELLACTLRYCSQESLQEAYCREFD